MYTAEDFIIINDLTFCESLLLHQSKVRHLTAQFFYINTETAVSCSDAQVINELSVNKKEHQLSTNDGDSKIREEKMLPSCQPLKFMRVMFTKTCTHFHRTTTSHIAKSERFTTKTPSLFTKPTLWPLLSRPSKNRIYAHRLSSNSGE